MGDIQILFNSDGVAELYDDTYDLTIHHESAQELEYTKKLLMNARWISVYSEEKPGEAEDVLCYCRYYDRYGGLIAEAHEIMKYHKNSGFSGVEWQSVTRVVAWRHLPEPPREDEL